MALNRSNVIFLGVTQGTQGSNLPALGDKALSYDLEGNKWKILAGIPQPPKVHGFNEQSFVKDTMTCNINQDKRGNL